MPTIPAILSQLADGLRASGAQSSPRNMEVLSAAMLFLERIKHPLEDEVAIAAYATAQLKSDDAKKVAIALGISADLIPSLTPSVVGVDLQLGQLLASGTGSQAIVAATVLFSWRAMAGKDGDDKRQTALHKIAENAALDGSRNPDLARTLATEMAKLSFTPHVPPPSCDYVFSISIDLVGSTDAKTRMMKLAQGDAARIDSFNEAVYREFCQIERKFYESATGHHAVSEAIDPSNFFTVKGIGDEIWILCEVAEKDIARVGHRLIDAGIQVATRSVRFRATQNDEGPRFDRNFDYGNIESIRSPIKIFVDLLSHASNLGRIRDEGLRRAIPDLLKSFYDREPTPLEIAGVIRRLCLSAYEPSGWFAFQEYRTDYIGHEIDRFFRTTKAAIPGTVTIGGAMASKMGLMFKPVSHGIHGVFTSSNTPLIGGLQNDPVHAHIRTFTPDQLKGIGYAYDTYTLFGPRSLNGIYVEMVADKQNGFPVMPYGDTQVLIRPDIVQELATEIVSAEKSKKP
ncbi:MAG TPA: hypothetical protein VIF02_13870 [Methylocella sp.]